MKLIRSSEGLQLSAPNIGKRVVFTPNTKNDAILLHRAAKAGYYYPLMALKHLEALSTGLTGKNNVFIPNINDFKTNSLQQVVVFVPGIAATVERRSNDTLAITRLVLSDEYKSIEKGSLQKPGVYSVVRDSDAIVAKYRNNGRVASMNERKVVIAAPVYAEPKTAAEEAVKRLIALFGVNAALKCDFDLFYSPLGSQCKGMRNYNPIAVNKTYAFSGLLANAMEQAKHKKGVEWSSERGGSVVFTQALMTLAAKNLSFRDQKHIVKMCWATSNPRPAFQAAKQLGMLSDINLLRSNHSVRTNLSAMVGNAQRAMDCDDPYQWSDYSRELANGTMAANTVIGIGALTGGALTGSPIMATVGTITSSLGALQFICQKYQERQARGY